MRQRRFFMPALAKFISSAHWVKAKWVDACTESTRTKTPRHLSHLSQCEAFFFKCFSTNLPTHLNFDLFRIGRRIMLSSCFNFFCTFAKIFENSLTSHWQRKLSLNVNWVDTQWTNFQIPWRIRIQNWIYVFLFVNPELSCVLLAKPVF
jgi:hypothetical protein